MNKFRLFLNYINQRKFTIGYTTTISLGAYYFYKLGRGDKDYYNNYQILNCNNCYSCIYCNECDHCENCYSCNYCFNCKNCDNCNYCDTCINCTDSDLFYAKNISNYQFESLSKYKIYYNKLNKKDKELLCNKFKEIISNKLIDENYNFTLLSLDDNDIINHPQYYLIVKEIVEILINKYNFPKDIFPNEIIIKINNNLLIKKLILKLYFL